MFAYHVYDYLVLFLLVPFFKETSIDSILNVFLSMEEEGLGRSISKDGHLLFKINAEKLKTEAHRLGLTLCEVDAALGKPSKVSPKFAIYAEGNSNLI